MNLEETIIRINDQISLQAISINDAHRLADLMFAIYPPVYAHYWEDGGQSYLNEIYSEENIKRDLSNPDSKYFFILYEGKTVGVLKYVFNERYEGSQLKTLKIHRIYLAESMQGKGFGSILFNWLEKATPPEVEEMWLEVMEAQPQAIRFYQKQGFSIVSKTSLRAKNMKEEYKGMYIMVKKMN